MTTTTIEIKSLQIAAKVVDEINQVTPEAHHLGDQCTLWLSELIKDQWGAFPTVPDTERAFPGLYVNDPSATACHTQYEWAVFRDGSPIIEIHVGNSIVAAYVGNYEEVVELKSDWL